jgi:hypothetical protein
MPVLVVIIITASLGLVACSTGAAPRVIDLPATTAGPTLVPTPPTEAVPPTVAACPRAEVDAWLDEAMPILNEGMGIMDRFVAVGKANDYSYMRESSKSYKIEALGLLGDYIDMNASREPLPPCVSDLEYTIGRAIGNIVNGLGQVEADNFDEGTRYFNEYLDLLDVANAQLEELQQNRD